MIQQILVPHSSKLREASIEADRPPLAEVLCGLAQAERDIAIFEPRVTNMQMASRLSKAKFGMSRLPFASLSSDPLADIWCTAFQCDTVRFALF
jgi:hypothetical protein